MASLTRFKLVFFVPPSSVEACKSAIFAAGAGKYPAYSECAWTSLGTGQFRPGDNANPHIGNVGQLEHTEEVRVEVLCRGVEVTRKSVEALKKAHPYEEPSYDVYRLEDF